MSFLDESAAMAERCVVSHTLAAVFSVFACGHALSCESFDIDFEPTGQFVPAGQDVTAPANLAVMLNARYAKKTSDPKATSLRVHVDGLANKMMILHRLDSGSDGPSFEYNVSCRNDEWHYAERGSTGAEGVFRDYALSVALKLLPGGQLRVRNEDTVVRGLTSKSTEVTLRAAIFNRSPAK